MFKDSVRVSARYSFIVQGLLNCHIYFLAFKIGGKNMKEPKIN